MNSQGTTGRRWLERKPSRSSRLLSVLLGAFSGLTLFLIFGAPYAANTTMHLMALAPLFAYFCFWVFTGSSRCSIWLGLHTLAGVFFGLVLFPLALALLIHVPLYQIFPTP